MHTHERDQAAQGEQTNSHSGGASSPLISLQREAGNAAVTDYLALGAKVWEQGQKLSAEAALDQDAPAYADAIYYALDGWNSDEDIANALQHLGGHAPARRVAIQNAFRNKWGTELQDYLVSQLEGDSVVDGLALLWSDNTQGYHVALGRALISYGVRQSEPIRILTALPLEGRKRVEITYNSVYSKVGEGSLRADLVEKMEENQEVQEALALLDHDITPAERLYLDSVAVEWGTKTDKVVSLVRDTFKSGPDKLSAMDLEWDQMVIGHKGDDQTWTKLSMTEAMGSELSGESWELVKACLDGMSTWRFGSLAAKVDALTDDGRWIDHADFTPTELAQMVAAEKTIVAATTGEHIWAGFGTNIPVLNEALITIRSVYDGRKYRAQRAGATPEILEVLDQEWEAKRAKLTNDAEWEVSGAAEQEARLALAGDLSFADRLYLAQRAHDENLAVKVATECWIAGEVESLHADAAEPRMENGVELRPRFNPIISSFLNHRRPFNRIKHILEPGDDQILRGSLRLWFEMSLVDGDAELKAVTEFLTMIPKSLRRDVLANFMDFQPAGPEPDAHVERRFVLWILKRSEQKGHPGSTECWNLAAVVDPLTNYADAATRAKVAYERAQGRHGAIHSGWFDSWWQEDQRAEDQEEGADLLETEEESLERLKYIAEQAAKPQGGSLDELVAQTGGKGIGGLVGIEADLYTQRAEELRKAKQEDAERLAFICQLAVEVVATIMTSGGYLGVVATALASSAVGMAAKEVMLGEDYELLDGDNAIELAASAAGALVSKNAGDFFKLRVGGDEALEKLGQIGAAKSAAVGKAGEIVGAGTVNYIFMDQFPTEDDILAKAGEILVSLAASSAGGHKAWLPKSELETRVANVRKYVIASLTEQSIDVTGNAAVQAMKTGALGSGTGLEWAETLGTDLFKKTIKKFTTLCADAEYPDRDDGMGWGTGAVKDIVTMGDTFKDLNVPIEQSDVEY